jgi:hypothetical protein
MQLITSNGQHILTFWPVLLDCVIMYAEYIAAFMTVYFYIPWISEFTQPVFVPAQNIVSSIAQLL